MTNDKEAEESKPLHDRYGGIMNYYRLFLKRCGRSNHDGYYDMRTVDLLLDEAAPAEVRQASMEVMFLTTTRLLMRASLILEISLADHDKRTRSNRNTWTELSPVIQEHASRVERQHNHLLHLLESEAKIKRLNSMAEKAFGQQSEPPNGEESECPAQSYALTPAVTTTEPRNGKLKRSSGSSMTTPPSSPETDRFSIGDSAGASDGASV